MLRLTLVVFLVCLTGIAVSFPRSDDSSDSSDSSDADHDHGIDLKNGTCAEKAERVLKFLWQRYKTRFAKRFIHHAFERKRLAIFRAALEKIHLHNLEADMGLHAYHCGLNELSDLTPEEMKSRTGLIPDTRRSFENEFEASIPLSELPESVDWRTKGWVTPVKNQGSCGSCWTFATTGTIEGQLANQTGRLISISEQQFLDCASNSQYGNNGCNGGVVSWALKYAKYVGFEEKETDYPYEAKQKTCRASAAYAVPHSKVVSYVDVKRDCEECLLEAVAKIGPVAVAIYASEHNFQNYKSGVYSCTAQHTINHAVLVVGYGIENGKKYWIVKNSWGEDWGDHGYVKIARTPGYQSCAILSQSSVVTKIE